MSQLGYGTGSSVRNEKYQLHEAIQYAVDNSFPQITPEMFVSGKIPEAIVQLEYDINLSSLNGVALDMHL